MCASLVALTSSCSFPDDGPDKKCRVFPRDRECPVPVCHVAEGGHYDQIWVCDEEELFEHVKGHYGDRIGYCDKIVQECIEEALDEVE